MKEQLGVERALDDLHPEPELKEDTAAQEEAHESGAAAAGGAAEAGSSADETAHDEL